MEANDYNCQVDLFGEIFLSWGDHLGARDDRSDWTCQNFRIVLKYTRILAKNKGGSNLRPLYVRS